MITVTVSINGNPIFTRSAWNTGKNLKEVTVYKLDTGDKIVHHRKDGAVKLSKMLLDTIKEE